MELNTKHTLIVNSCPPTLREFSLVGGRLFSDGSKLLKTPFLESFGQLSDFRDRRPESSKAQKILNKGIEDAKKKIMTLTRKDSFTIKKSTSNSNKTAELESFIENIDWDPYLELDETVPVTKANDKKKVQVVEKVRNVKEVNATPKVILSTKILQKYALRFIAKKITNKLRKNRKKRRMVSEELLQTEKEYINHLVVCEEVYVNPLKKMVQDKLITQKDYSNLFGAFFVQLKNVNKEFLTSLEQIMYKDGVFDHNAPLSKPISTIAPFFKMYSSYCGSYKRAIETWKTLKTKSREDVQKIVLKMDKDPRTTKLGLISYLILPIQRIPRYRLLIRDLIKCTNKEHSDYKKLNDAMEKIMEVAGFLDDAIADYEDSEKLRLIQENMIMGGKKLEIVSPHRKFIKKGEVDLGIKTTKKCMLFLFDDMVVFAEPEKNEMFRYLSHVSLLNLKVYDCKDSKSHDTKIRLSDAKGENIVFTCGSTKEKDIWMYDIFKTIVELKGKRKLDEVKVTDKSLTTKGVASRNVMNLRKELCVEYVKMNKGIFLCYSSKDNKPQPRYLCVSGSEKNIDIFSNKDMNLRLEQIPLGEVQDLITGQNTTPFKKIPCSALEGVSFSLLYGKGGRNEHGIWTGKSLDLIAPTKEIFMVWTKALSFILMDKGETTSERNKLKWDLKVKPFLQFVGNDSFTWGRGECGALGHPGKNEEKDQKVPIMQRDFSYLDVSNIKISEDSMYATTSDGKVFSWGGGKFGQLGHGDTANYHKPMMINHFEDIKIIQVAAKGFHALFLSENGRVFGCGKNENGQVGIDSKTKKKQIFPKRINFPGAEKIKYIEVGTNHSGAICSKGKVYTWGLGKDGQLCHGKDFLEDVHSPKLVEKLNDIKQLAFGFAHCLALTNEGNVYVWGEGQDGQLGNGKMGKGVCAYDPSPLQSVFLRKKVVQIEAGSFYSAAVTNVGKLYLWGSNVYGQVGNGKKENVKYPTLVTSLAQIKCLRVECGSFHSLAQMENGKLMSWGAGTFGRLGQGTEKDQPTPKEVKLSRKIITIAAGGSMSAAVVSHKDAEKQEVKKGVCQECERTFRKKKTNCRCCGAFCCKDCLKHKIPLPLKGYFEPTNVCNTCFEILKEKYK